MDRSELPYYDSFQQKYEMNKFDSKLRFCIKGEIVCCSKILFLMQSSFDKNLLNKDTINIDIEYRHATVESVRIFANWIDSKNKDPIIANLDIKMYLILAKLANLYKVEKLSDQIYTKLKKSNEESEKKRNRIEVKFVGMPLDEGEKETIVKDFNLFLYNDKFNDSKFYTYSDIQNLRYEDKIEILKKAIDAGKRPSLLSSIRMFNPKELSSNEINQDLVPLFQLSKTGLLYFLNLRNKLDESGQLKNENVKNKNVKSDNNQIETKKMSTKLEKYRTKFNDLKKKFDDLFKKYTEISNEYVSIQGQLNHFDEELKSLNETYEKQKKNISTLWKSDSEYNEIISKDKEKNEALEKIKKDEKSYINLTETTKDCILQNNIFSKILFYSLSCQYVDDSISTTDRILTYRESIDFSFNSDTSKSFICDFIDNFVFLPLYYELGFLYRPSDYSWKFLAEFKNDIYKEPTKEEEKPKEEKPKEPNEEEEKEDQKFYETHEDLKDESEREWCLINDYNFNEKLENPDESYDSNWDDPFILKFKFLPGFFPKSIKLQLNDVKKLNDDQKSLKKCFSHFRIVGILKYMNFKVNESSKIQKNE